MEYELLMRNWYKNNNWCGKKKETNIFDNKLILIGFASMENQ